MVCSPRNTPMNPSSYGITALLKILATPFTGLRPIIGFSLYLHTGAPVKFSGLSCHGTFGTGWLIILYLLILFLHFCVSFVHASIIYFSIFIFCTYAKLCMQSSDFLHLFLICFLLQETLNSSRSVRISVPHTQRFCPDPVGC